MPLVSTTGTVTRPGPHGQRLEEHDTQRGIDTALATFRDLGAELREVQLSPLQDWAACGSLISITERSAAYEEWSRTGLGDFSERMRSRLMLGAFVSASTMSRRSAGAANCAPNCSRR